MRSSRVCAVAAVGLLVVTGCTGGAEPSPTPAVQPDRPRSPIAEPGALLTAELRTSSHDRALGQTQVWIRNHTEADVDPVSILYRHPRWRRPVQAQRLRSIPAGSQRGYSLRLPRRPRCADPAAEPGASAGSVELSTARGPVPVEFADPLEIAVSYLDERCLELATDRVAALRWSARLAPDPTPGALGALVLRARPTGAPGRVRVEQINGTPVLTPIGAAFWEPGLVASARTGVRRVRLPVAPARCDPHAFQESGGATAFRVHVRVLGRSGEPRRQGSFVLRLGAAGTKAVLDAAVAACGLTP